MTKTSVPSQLFVHKVLLSLQFLQGLSQKKDGATACKITSYIKRNFPNDGDTASQVQASLDECVHYGFVEKRRNKYILVGPIASIQMQPHNSQYREREVERVRKIFPYDWKHSRRRRRYQRKRVSNNGAIASFFRTIKNWLFGGWKSCPDDIVLPKRVYSKRLVNLENFRRMRRRKRCSRSGCITSHKSTYDSDSKKAYKKSNELDSMGCNELKKRRDKLRSEASRILEKYSEKCDRNKSKRKHNQKACDVCSLSDSHTSECSADYDLR
ncbi:hypothetical protein Trydic_g23614 [Trypoxylus dichotomus]